MKIICIVPARMGSSRFPGKPLELIDDKTMLEHCLLNAQNSNIFDHVIAATCDDEILYHLNERGYKCVMTSSDHERCTSRTLEALEKFEEEVHEEFDYVLMLQGDEPLITPTMFEKNVAELVKDGVEVTNLMTKTKDINELHDINEVKVVFDQNNDALFFSRAPIPTTKDKIEYSSYKQVCAIGFAREALIGFESLGESNLERIESVDMLRLLETGTKVRMVEVEGDIASVDTPEDLEKVKQIIQSSGE